LWLKQLRVSSRLRQGVSTLVSRPMPGPTSSTTYAGLVASRYDEQIFYNVSGPLVQWQLAHVVDKLNLQPGHHLVDIGGGTGGFTHELARHLVLAGDATPSVTLVEPSAEMIAQASKRSEPSLTVVHTDVSTFLKDKIECDRVLLKEVVHHFPETERNHVFKNIFGMLSPGGKVLVITRPALLTGFPFPDFFLRYWAENQPTPESYEAHIREAGFEVCNDAPESFPLRIARAVWYRMLRERFWSWLSYFSDEQIEAGVEELELRYPGADDFEFVERVHFIVGTKVATDKPM